MTLKVVLLMLALLLLLAVEGEALVSWPESALNSRQTEGFLRG